MTVLCAIAEGSLLYPLVINSAKGKILKHLKSHRFGGTSAIADKMWVHAVIFRDGTRWDGRNGHTSRGFSRVIFDKIAKKPMKYDEMYKDYIDTFSRSWNEYQRMSGK
jgi:hypothetical protein